MLMEQIGRYNDLSPKLRTELEEKVRAFGPRVRYKFNISNENPDPLKQNGKTVWPSRWTLDPVTFTITDKHETRDGKSKVKQIGIVKKLNEKGEPEMFERIRVVEGNQGVLNLDLSDPEDFAKALNLELHPKHDGGEFQNKNVQPKFTRIDEARLATEKRTGRTSLVAALNKAQAMSEADVMEFVQAMGWSEGDTLEEQRNQIEEFAEANPDVFVKLTEGDIVSIRAVVSQALSKKVIEFDNAEYKYSWAGTKQTIAVLSQVESKSHIEQFAEWIKTNGDKSNEIYKKIKELVK